MAKFIIDGITMEQAIQLANWFTNQGEQYCVPWFEEAEVQAPFVVYDSEWKTISEDFVSIKCK